MPKDGGEIDQKNIVYNDAVDDNEIDDLNKEDTLHFKDGLANNNNNNNDDTNSRYGLVVDRFLLRDRSRVRFP